MAVAQAERLATGSAGVGADELVQLSGISGQLVVLLAVVVG